MTRFLTAVCLAALLWPAPALSQAPGAHAWVDSSSYLIGDWIRVHVDITHPKGARLTPVVGDTVNGFQVIGRTPLAPEGETTTSTEFVLARYDSGRAIIPPLTFAYLMPGDSSPRTLSSNALMVSVRRLDVDTTLAIKDVKPPLSIPLSLAELALYAGIAVVIALLAWLLYRLWKKRRQKASGEIYVPPKRPAHLIAYEELAMLKEKKLWQQGLVKQYYSEATEIFRRYLENRYTLQALEETTDEILAGLQKLRMTPDLLHSVEGILRRADLVKFAKHQPGIPEHEEILTVITTLIDRTKIVEMTPAAHPESAGAEHVGA